MKIPTLLTISLSGALLAGCATPPQTQYQAAVTTRNIQLASFGVDSGQPAALPVETYLEDSHDVDFFVQVALERNPEIIAAQRAVAAQAQVIPQVTALTDPVLTDTFQPFDSHSVQTAAGRGPNTLTLSQKLPWLGKLRVRGEVAEQEAKMALTRLAQAELKVIEDVKLSYYELAFSQEAIKIIEGDKNLLTQLLQFAEARYRTNSTSQQDVLRAQVEIERLEDRLIGLRKQQGMSRADLAKVLHTSPDAELLVDIDEDIAPVPQQIDALYEAAVRCRPELQERLHAIIRSERKRELARLNYYPDFNVGMGWQSITGNDAISPVANGNDNLSFMVGVTLPVWRDRLTAGVREAENRTVESARRYDSSRDDTMRMIRRLVVQAESQEQQIELYSKSIIPKAEQALRISAADYKVNKLDFQQILDNWSDVLNFHLQVARFEASLNQTLASLERVIGCQLATLPEAREMPVLPEMSVLPAIPDTDSSSKDKESPEPQSLDEG